MDLTVALLAFLAPIPPIVLAYILTSRKLKRLQGERKNDAARS